MNSLFCKVDKIELFSFEELFDRFIQYLNYSEESDSGRVFNPISIGCCRAMMIEPFEQLITEMKSRKVNSSGT